MKTVFPMLLVLVCFAGLALRAEDAGATQPTTAEVKKNVQDGNALLVDVRDQKEFTDGHLTGATNVPIAGIRTKDFTSEFSKSKLTYLYCGCPEGKGAFEASKIMNAEGYNTVPLKANYKELLKDGYEQAK